MHAAAVSSGPLRRVLFVALTSVALALTACGGDDEKTADKPAAPKKASFSDAGNLRQLPKRAAKPNIKGSADVSIEEFLHAVNADATQYWENVFRKSDLEFTAPEEKVVTKSDEADCNGDAVSSDDQAYYCKPDESVLLTTGWFDKEAKPLGDGAMLTMVSVVQAFHTFDEVGGYDAVDQKEISESKAELVVVCFAGAYVGNVGDRDQLEEGDTREALTLIDKLAGESDAGTSQLKEALAQGFNDGPGSCPEIEA